MIQRLSERPPVGAWILDNNNPWNEDASLLAKRVIDIVKQE